jgi:DNA-binding XRE family transcriptional regulator
MEAEVAHFFRDLRAAMQMSQAQAAQWLATRTDIIAALETGDVSVLPPWPECCRIVRTYTAPVGLDPRPILHSLEALLAVAARTPKPAPKRTFVPRLSRQSKAAANPAIAAVSANVGRLLRGRNGRALFAVAVPVGLLVLLTQTSVLEAAVAQLPPSVARIVRGAQDYVTLQLAPVRDGLRWIDVRDPRSRRSDKLRTAAQSD